MSEALLHTILQQRKQFLSFVRRRVSDPAVAEDLLQAAYIRAIQREDSLQDERSAVGWFYRILRNTVIDYYRRRSTEDKGLEAWSRELERAVAPSTETRDEVCTCLAAILETLKPAYAELLRAVDLDEQPLRDFADEHALSATNAGVRAHRARAALRKQLIKVCGVCAEHACLNCTCRSQDHKNPRSTA